jgi:uncharacterized protein
LTGRRRHLAALLSPIILIGICRAAQFAAGPALGAWAWLPTMLLFWGVAGLVILWTGGLSSVQRWLQPARGGTLWGLLALLMGVLSLPGFLQHGEILLQSRTILCLSVAFAVINPWFEEAYFRGLLLDATAHWNPLPSVMYSAVWFAISHPLVWGVHSVAMRHWVILPVLAIVGAVWAMAYRRSRTLRWSIAGHACANLFGMSVPVLLNVHVPYGV